MPKEKSAGKIMSPHTKATPVTMETTMVASVGRAESLPR